MRGKRVMPPPPQWFFGAFRLDVENACLWHGAQRVVLKPKAFAVLHHLVTHADRLVTKEALFEAVWPDTAVGDAVLKVYINELRKALGDTAKTPQFIATVHRRGYRFITPVTAAEPTDVGRHLPTPAERPQPLPEPSVPQTAPLLERDAVIQRLQTALAQVRSGARQVVFVTGEPGIGKTTVVEAFIARASTDPQLWVAHGQCVEHYGSGEPYLPVLEALGQLCRVPQGDHLVAFLRQQAPTWLAQMPWLLENTDRELLQCELRGRHASACYGNWPN
jgi:DNA-binding winged helix-turn-helix (wHTH) protein